MNRGVPDQLSKEYQACSIYPARSDSTFDFSQAKYGLSLGRAARNDAGVSDRLSVFSVSDDTGGKQASNRSTRQKNAVCQEPQGDRGFEAQTEEAPDERESFFSMLSVRQLLRTCVKFC